MHIKLIEALKKRKNPDLPVREWIDDPNRTITRVCAVSNDRAGLFSVLAGVLSVSGFDILGSKVLTRTDGITIDTFYLTGVSGGVSNNMRIREMFSRKVAAALADIHSLDGDVLRLPAAEERVRAFGRIYAPRERKNRIGGSRARQGGAALQNSQNCKGLRVRHSFRADKHRGGLGARHFSYIGASACGIEV